MIIFGVRGVTMTSGRGEFDCPMCHEGRRYRHRKVRRFFTLYFIPLIPLNTLGELIECETCLGTFKMEVLAYDRTAGVKIEAAFQIAVRRVMVLMMMADGIIDDSEIKAIQILSAKIGGGVLSEIDIRSEIKAAETDGQGMADYLSGILGTINASDKELIVKAAYLVAHSDGEFPESEQQLLSKIGLILEISNKRMKGIMASTPTFVIES